MEDWSIDMTDAVPSAYVASPECAERQCDITRTYDVRWLRFVYQHGDNPEAVLFEDRYSLRHDPAAEVRRRFRVWAERIHRYQEGAYVPA